jgi:hypothetical protein
MAHMRDLATHVSPTRVLDLRFGYSYGDAVAYIHSLDMSAISRYKAFQSFDFFYIFIYGSFYVFSLHWLASYVTRRRWVVWAVIAFPLVAVVCDCAENFSIRYMLQAGTAHISPGIVTLSSCFTTTKFILAYLSMGLLAVFLLVAIYRVGKRRVSKMGTRAN